MLLYIERWLKAPVGGWQRRAAYGGYAAGCGELTEKTQIVYCKQQVENTTNMFAVTAIGLTRSRNLL